MLGRRLAILACALLCAAAVACGGDDAPEPTLTAAITNTPVVIASATPTAMPTAVTVTETEVITYEPPATAATQMTGNCFGASVVVQRLGAWRCMASNEIYDPCFGEQSAMTVICVDNPTKPEEAVQLNLLSRACDDVLGSTLCAVTELPPSGRDLPWAIRTARGTVCILQQGTLTQRNGELVHYGCDDRITVVGEPTEGTVWTIRTAPDTPPSAPLETIQLQTVWQ